MKVSSPGERDPKGGRESEFAEDSRGGGGVAGWVPLRVLLRDRAAKSF